MNEIQKFVNEQLGCEIRVLDRDGTPWFVAKDVAGSLGYANPSEAVRDHCKRTSKTLVQVSGQGRETLIIPEADLYRLIMRSQNPEAEAFQDWIVEEVLPSIRKHGAYMTQQVAQQAYDNPETVVALARKILEDAQRIGFLKQRDDIFGNRTPFGEISAETGLPRVKPVRGYLRSIPTGYEFVPDSIQLSLFAPMTSETSRLGQAANNLCQCR